MENSQIFFRGALALALGLIVGFQRERTQPSVAGVRTFPLFTLSGFFASLLSSIFEGWILSAGAIVLGILLLIGFLKERQARHVDLGVTTEAAGVLLYWVSLLSGLTDVDAITISTAKLITKERLEPQIGWRVMLIASLSNLGLKAIIGVALSRAKLRWNLIATFAIAISAGFLLLMFWPEYASW